MPWLKPGHSLHLHRKHAAAFEVSIPLHAFPAAEAREDYLVSSQLFQQAKGFRGRGGSTTQRLDGEAKGHPTCF